MTNNELGYILGLSNAVGQSSVGQSSVGQSSVGQSSVGQSSVGQSSVGQSSAGQSPVGQKVTVHQSAVGLATVSDNIAVRQSAVSWKMYLQLRWSIYRFHSNFHFQKFKNINNCFIYNFDDVHTQQYNNVFFYGNE
jgi:hypothetical protein